MTETEKDALNETEPLTLLPDKAKCGTDDADKKEEVKKEAVPDEKKNGKSNETNDSSKGKGMNLRAFLSLNTLVGVLGVTYVGKLVSSLYEVSRVPVFDPNIDSKSTFAVRPIISAGLEFDYLLYLSQEHNPPSLSKARKKSVYIGGFLGAVYSDTAEHPRTISSHRNASGNGDIEIANLSLPESFRTQNRTIYLHSYLVPSGKTTPLQRHTTPLSLFLRPGNTGHGSAKKRFLLSDLKAQSDDAALAEEDTSSGSGSGSSREPFVSLPPRIEVGVVLETRELDGRELWKKGFGNLVDVKAKRLKLPLHVNTLTSPRDEYTSVGSGEPLKLQVSYKAIGLGYFMLQETLIRSFDEVENIMKVNQYDLDSFRMMISGSGPFKLCFVYLITLLHVFLEYLALKSDFSFWKSRVSFEGLSASSIKMTLGIEIISFLYVLELGESQIVLYFLAARMAFNIWKLLKMRRASKTQAGDTESSGETLHEAELRCMKVLGACLAPVVAGVCVYRLVYYEFRSWYSWLVLSLAMCAEVLGFVTMTPQVFLNYRLKSVEHLPWRALSYQAVNTFIDDVFTLVIRVPEIHKFSVLRDDIVFVICMVQRWLYRDRRGVEGPPPEDTSASEKAPASTSEIMTTKDSASAKDELRLRK